MTRLWCGLLLSGCLSLASTSGAAGALADLRATLPPPNVIPEPIPGQGCAVPPIPRLRPPELQGLGYHIGLGVEWIDFNLNGRRYVVEYDIRRQNENGTVETTPFPVRYFLDANRNGQFDVPGEVWTDTQGNGRCADLELVPATDERPRNRKPTAG